MKCELISDVAGQDGSSLAGVLLEKGYNGIYAYNALNKAVYMITIVNN